MAAYAEGLHFFVDPRSGLLLLPTFQLDFIEQSHLFLQENTFSDIILMASFHMVPLLPSALKL